MELSNLVEKVVSGLRDVLKVGNQAMVGIDIGLSSVKIAELKQSGDTYKLTGYATVDLPEGALIEDDIQKPEEIISAINQCLGMLKTSAQNAAISLYGPNTVAKKLQLAGGSDDEIDDQVSWEAEQYLPFSVDDSTMDHYVFGENEGGGVDVFVAAARNDIVEMFRELVEKTDVRLKVKIVDLGVVSISNVFVHVLQDQIEDPNQSFIFMDIGAQNTHFIIYRGNGILFTKEVNIGGVIITEEIQRQMGVNYNEAEDLKIIGDENGNLPEEIVEIIEDVLESFFAEIKKTVDFYITSTSDDSLSGVIVTGGGALIPGLLEGLEALLGFPASVLSPFEKLEYDRKKFSEDQLNMISFRGGVAMGLAMRSLN